MCGLKHGKSFERRKPIRVTPRAGVWIETFNAYVLVSLNVFVTPRAGVWIETSPDLPFPINLSHVTPRAGVWIETSDSLLRTFG